MRKYLKFIPLVLLISVAGCSDDPASNNNGITTFTGTNGFVINGDSLSNVVVTAESATATSSTIFIATSTTVTLSAHLNNEPIEFKLHILDPSATGTFNWTTGNANVTADLEIDDSFSRGYTSVSGKTTIDKVGAVGQTIDGSFSGTMKSKENPDVTVEVNGKFSATRQ